MWKLIVRLQPVVKTKPKVDPSQQRPATLRLSTSRPEGRPIDDGLVLLSEVQEEAAALVQRSVDTKIARHRDWNRGFLDQTWNPLTPPPDDSVMSGFLPRVEEYQLPTPPTSVTEEQGDDEQKDVVMQNADPADLPTPVSDEDPQPARTMFRFASPAPDAHVPAFRRRYGRNGILHIEERRSKKELVLGSSGVVYDSDGDGEEACVLYPIDYYGDLSLNHRASLLSSRARVEPTSGAEQASRRTSSIGNDVAMSDGHIPAGQSQQQGQAVAASSG